MKYITKAVLLIFSISLFSLTFMSSCERFFLGEDEANTRMNNFELFWNDFDKHYGLFYARQLNWDSIYNEYKPLISEETTDDELWLYFTEMIEYLDDGHTNLFQILEDKSTLQYTSGDALNVKSGEAFSLNMIDSIYLNNFAVYSEENDAISSGLVKDKNIGYIHLKGFGGYEIDHFEDAMKTIGDQNALIFDVRQNRGGDGDLAQEIASIFADKEVLAYTSQTRNGPEYDDFDEKTDHITYFSAGLQFTKPVMILTDRATVSACEEMLLFTDLFDDVIQIGDTTAGDFSDLSPFRFLPNGWLYTFSNQMYLLPNGQSLDGIGHVPDVYIKNSKIDIENGKDLVLERAILYLKEEYGIE